MSSYRRLSAAIIAGLMIATIAGPALAQGDTSDKRIALSNNYAGNSWRQAMLTSWDKITQPAVADGIVAAADPFTTAQNEVTEQAAQMQNLVLQGYDAIVLNAASTDGLNGTVKEACDAGVVVVSFDGVATEPCGYRVAIDFHEWGLKQMDFLAEKLPEGGKLLEIRGLAGTWIDQEVHRGIEDGIATYPQFEVVGSVNGDWAQDVTQKAVAGILPSLPEGIVGVVTQGGDGYGAAQAFEATDRPIPIILMGNRYEELMWWKEQKDANGYETMSMSIAPGIATLAFWVAQQILAGVEVPHDLIAPYPIVTQDTLEDYLAKTEEGSVTNVEYTLEETQAFLAEAAAAE